MGTPNFVRVDRNVSTLGFPRWLNGKIRLPMQEMLGDGV